MFHAPARRGFLAGSLVLLTSVVCSHVPPPPPPPVMKAPAPSPPTGTRTVYVSGYDPTISVLKLDMVSGVLSPASTVRSGKAPSYMALAPDKRTLYAVDEGKRSGLAAFSIDAASGTPKEINRILTGGAGACHLAVDPSGKFLLTAHYDSGMVTVHALRPDGGIGDKVDHKSPGKNAHQVVFASGGRFVFVPFLGSNVVAQYHFEAGKLVPNDPPTVAVKGGPRHLVFDHDEKHAYVLSELENLVTSFDYDKATGRLSKPETLSTLQPGGKKKEGGHIVLHSSGKFLYASNRVDNSMAIFDVDATSGRLKNASWQRDKVNYVRDFAIDDSGTYLLAANQKANRVVVFQIDPMTGQLAPHGDPLAVPAGPAFVSIVSLP